MSIPLELVLRYDTAPVEDDSHDHRPNFRESDDNALVTSAKTGNIDAFSELVRRYRNDVYSMAWQFVRNREDAWDITQDVFVRADRSIRKFRGESSFKTWILRITANLCKDFFKKRRLKTVALDDSAANVAASEPQADPDRRLEAKELGGAIEKALQRLSPNHYQAFVLREFEGFSYQDIAKTAGCSLGTVMSRLHHARKKLQSSLTEMGYGELSSHGEDA